MRPSCHHYIQWSIIPTIKIWRYCKSFPSLLENNPSPLLKSMIIYRMAKSKSADWNAGWSNNLISNRLLSFLLMQTFKIQSKSGGCRSNCFLLITNKTFLLWWVWSFLWEHLHTSLCGPQCCPHQQVGSAAPTLRLELIMIMELWQIYRGFSTEISVTSSNHWRDGSII